jgi:hypothetical protein
LPDLISNLQANTVYWRECADSLLSQEKETERQQEIARTVLHRTNSILEDSELESEK